MHSVRIVGPGRAGLSLARALDLIGWHVEGVLGRSDDLSHASDGVDVVVIATPDGVIADAASSMAPNPGAAVLHLSGALGVGVLRPHPRRGALHPLVPLPNAETGCHRLMSGITFAVAGDDLATTMATALRGSIVRIDDDDRVKYHAAACIAANHVVALLGQVERIAHDVGLDVQAFLGLTRAALDDVSSLGPKLALTGPAVRGDWVTMDRHLDALAPEERAAYSACVALALRLSDVDQASGSGPDLSRLDRLDLPDDPFVAEAR